MKIIFSQSNQEMFNIEPSCSVCFSLARGKPDGFLSIYHYVFLNYSHPVATAISDKEIDMSGKTDTRFLECMYKVKPYR